MTDYISREKTLERIDSIYDCADMVFKPNDKICKPEDCKGCKWAATRDAIRRIIADAIPAADVRPVVRGKWKRVDYRSTVVTFKCSECGYYAHTLATNFCPTCGADMREENNEKSD